MGEDCSHPYSHKARLAGTEAERHRLNPCTMVQKPRHCGVLSKLGGDMAWCEVGVVWQVGLVRVVGFVNRGKVRSMIAVSFTSAPKYLRRSKVAMIPSCAAQNMALPPSLSILDLYSTKVTKSLSRRFVRLRATGDQQHELIWES